MKPPTEKQINFAGKISEALNIELPEKYTAQAYWKFINSNIHQFSDCINSDPVFDEDCFIYPVEWEYDGDGCWLSP